MAKMTSDRAYGSLGSARTRDLSLYGFPVRVYYRFAEQYVRYFDSSISAEALFNLAGTTAQFQRNRCSISPVWLRNLDGIYNCKV